MLRQGTAVSYKERGGRIVVQMLLNHGWSFSLDGSGAQPVCLPHDWLIGDARNHYKTGTGVYTRKLNIEPQQGDDITGEKRLSLRFEGVYMDSTLRVNGQSAGEWKYGYTTFELDITPYVREGDNEIELTVRYDGQSSRWYTGAGIYRDVWFIVRNACHFIADGIYVTTEYKDNAWTWQVNAQVSSGGCAYEEKHTLLDENGTVMQDKDIKPWDINDPRLYIVRSQLFADGKETDRVETRVGFRDVKFSADEGFFLNGRPLKIFGVCQHHDLGALGAAFHKDAERRRLDILRGMGVNAIRTAHNPPAPGLLDLCDEMGFLVMDELTDIWKRPKTPGDYARFFEHWIERDAASWIRRDRNHPCVIMWSVGNEISDTHADAADGSATLRALLELVEKYDPQGNAQATLCSNYMPWENTQECIQNCSDKLRLIGYNYAENYYHEHHKRFPLWVIYGSETSSTLQSRGVYHFPLSRPVLADDDLQCSALGNTTTSWGAKNVQSAISDDFDAPFSLGQFVWSGTDYLGEPTPYHTKNCYFGQIDTAGFEKDSYYVFKAAWTDYRKDPFVHIYPYWDFSPGQLIDVSVCSNAPKVALFLNDKKIGEADLTSGPEKWIANWKIAYEEGALKAQAFDDSGNMVAQTQRTSFGDAAVLKTETVTYSGLDFVTITALDDKGRTVENANCRALVAVEGGELLALDNGDPTDYESYHHTSRRLFNGRLLAMIKRTGKENPAVSVSMCRTDVPVRKIELAKKVCKNETVVTARTYPADAVYDDITWRLTDAGGVDSPMGELLISGDGKEATVIHKGDGTGYIRCSAGNGREHPALISVLEIEITGIGQPYLNPYEFLSAGLYTACNSPPGSGIERGIATRRLDETHIGFENIDFGAFGSEEITLWLFPMGGEPFDFEIWEGMPSGGGEKIYTAHYGKGSIWNTYIEASYKLPRKITGRTTLCFVFHDKVHVKGFIFKKPVKAFTKLYAAQCDHIYGDSFELGEKSVLGIGNNVSIIFEDMDFGSSGAGEVTICYRSQQDINPVRIDFSGDAAGGGSVTGGCTAAVCMLDLPRNDSFAQKTYRLDSNVKGVCKVSLVFLPGCNMDLESIQFN